MGELAGKNEYRLYDYLDSGNGYKVRLILEQLKLPWKLLELDILKQETGTVEFLEMNPNGKIPVLQLPNGDSLAESNAILFYLAEGSDLIPSDPFLRAKVLQWMFFEQYSHEPYIAISRFWLRHCNPDEYRELLAEKKKPGEKALAIMEKHLSQHPFFVGDQYSIADIALFAYTHVAPEGGFDLQVYPAIRSWIQRIEQQPCFIPLDWRP